LLSPDPAKNGPGSATLPEKCFVTVPLKIDIWNDREGSTENSILSDLGLIEHVAGQPGRSEGRDRDGEVAEEEQEPEPGQEQARQQQEEQERGQVPYLPYLPT